MVEIAILIVALAALAAAIGAIWASRAAHRSAVSAWDAAQFTEKIERRGLSRDLTITANRIVAESLQIALLIEELKTEYRLLANASGESGSTREKLLIHEAKAKEKEVRRLREEATKLMEDRALIAAATEETMTQLLSKFDGYLVQVLRIKDSLGRQVTATAGDNRIHRERRIRALYRQR